MTRALDVANDLSTFQSKYNNGVLDNVTLTNSIIDTTTTTNGTFTLSGNLKIPENYGIDFNNYGSEDSNSATTVGNNLLDDYEEGYWFPYIDGSTTGSITSFIERIGWYIKVGGVCHVGFYLANPGTNSGLTGNWLIKGLPFISKSHLSQGYGTNYYSEGPITYNRGLSYNGSYLTLAIGNGWNYAIINQHYTDGTESGTITNTTMSSSLLMKGSVSYTVD